MREPPLRRDGGFSCQDQPPSLVSRKAARNHRSHRSQETTVAADLGMIGSVKSLPNSSPRPLYTLYHVASFCLAAADLPADTSRE